MTAVLCCAGASSVLRSGPRARVASRRLLVGMQCWLALWCMSVAAVHAARACGRGWPLTARWPTAGTGSGILLQKVTGLLQPPPPPYELGPRPVASKAQPAGKPDSITCEVGDSPATESLPARAKGRPRECCSLPRTLVRHSPLPALLALSLATCAPLHLQPAPRPFAASPVPHCAATRKKLTAGPMLPLVGGPGCAPGLARPGPRMPAPGLGLVRLGQTANGPTTTSGRTGRPHRRGGRGRSARGDAGAVGGEPNWFSLRSAPRARSSAQHQRDALRAAERGTPSWRKPASSGAARVRLLQPATCAGTPPEGLAPLAALHATKERLARLEGGNAQQQQSDTSLLSWKDLTLTKHRCALAPAPCTHPD
jgi:hypothetical protein